MTRFPLPIVSLAIVGIICLPACTSPNGAARESTDATISIVVTTGMVADLVRYVAGDHAQVTGLIGEGIDPHLFQPTTSDIARIMQADVVFYSGLHLEGAMQTAFESAAASGKVVRAVTDGIPAENIRVSDEYKGFPDPHVWNDARAWAGCLNTVVDVLSERYPEFSEEFQSNAERFRREIERVDDYARQIVGTIPESQRTLVTAHDAFAYFARAYGLQVQSVQGITTESDPGVQDINNLVDYLVEHRIPAIFVESTINQANIRAVIEGAQQRDWSVTIGGTLYSDAMGPTGAYEGTYIGMIDHNATVITRALGGEAPEGGMDGQLTLHLKESGK